MYIETKRPLCHISLTQKEATFEVRHQSLSQSKTLRLSQFSLDSIQEFIEERTRKALFIAKKDCKVCTDTFMHVLKSVSHA